MSGHDDNDLSISDDMNTHYHHQIISSVAPKCDTNTHGVHTSCSDINSGSPLDSLPFSYLFSETSALLLQQTRFMPSTQIYAKI